MANRRDVFRPWRGVCNWIVRVPVYSPASPEPRLVRTPSNASVVDVLDHVLDKGIVIDAWVCVSVVGISLVSLHARIVVASIETYLRHASARGDAMTTEPQYH
jgi:Gas vesicle protein